MKKYIFMAAALMMMGMGMSSCSNEDEITEVEQAPKKVQLTLTATFDMGGETRAAVWDTDGITPKFSNGDQVGVYSDNHDTAEPLEVTVDGNGIATLTGTVTEASTYHLVYPYRSNTTYNSTTKKISGFNNFATGGSAYPVSARHYAMTDVIEGNVTFKPLCAILKGAAVDEDETDKMIYIKSARLKSPVITVDGTGGASVYAEEDSQDNPFKSSYLVTYTAYNTSQLSYFRYYAVAPGSVILVKGTSSSNVTKQATVEAGKIYNVAP